MRQSMVVSRSAEPTSEASAKATTLIDSTTTSVRARAVCICFWAMRPAKSSSKKVTDWPIVQRCNRERTSGLTLGATTTLLAAAASPKTSGRSTRKKPTKRAISSRLSAK